MQMRDIAGRLLKPFIWLRRKSAEKALAFGIRYAPEYFMAKVQETSVMATRSMVIAELDRRGLSHCSMCPNRFSLRRVKDALYCPKCVDRLGSALKKLEEAVGNKNKKKEEANTR